MVRVLYDHKGLDAAYGGVSCYFNNVIAHLPEDIQPCVSLVRTSNQFLQSPPFNVSPTQMTLDDFRRVWLHGHSFHGAGQLFVMLGKLFPRMFPNNFVVNECAFMQRVQNGDFDVCHLTKAHPEVDETLRLYGKKPIVITVHDLIPDLAGNKKVIAARRQVLDHATHIIAVSNCTKEDLIRLYDVPEEKITVIYHGHNFSSSTCDAPLPSRLTTLIGKPYLLFVGRREGYKNFEWFIRAVSKLLRDRQLNLVCTGTQFSTHEMTLIDSLGVGKLVHQVYLLNEEFPSVYAHATAFIYPSLYEGFGIPILDAFSAGCPVILSDCSCFPEVGGDAALYFKQDDVFGLYRQIVSLCDDKLIRENCIARGRHRAGFFSWVKCAAQHAAVYRKCIEEGN